MEQQAQQMWAASEEEIEDEDDTEDYLQDPELWQDRLPQPFRMIDGLLQDLLTQVWEAVEARREREEEEARLHMPEIVAENTALKGLQGIHAVKEGRESEVVFVACDDGLKVICIKDGEMVCTAISSDEPLSSLAVGWIDDVHIAAACTKPGRQ